MPIKFKPSHKSYKKGEGTKIEHYYIKNTYFGWILDSDHE